MKRAFLNLQHICIRTARLLLGFVIKLLNGLGRLLRPVEGAIRILGKFQPIISLLFSILVSVYFVSNVFISMDVGKQYTILIALITLISAICGLTFRASASTTDPLHKVGLYRIGIKFFMGDVSLISSLSIVFIQPIFIQMVTEQLDKIPGSRNALINAFNSVNSVSFVFAIGISWYALNKLSYLLVAIDN